MEGAEVGLHPLMELLGKLPDRLAGLGVEVIILLLRLIVEDLIGLDQLVYLLCVHPL